MDDAAEKLHLERVVRHSVRGQILRHLCLVYGEENTALELNDLRETHLPVPVSIEAELRYLKELGYIAELPRSKREKYRHFFATAKGYALWCGDAEDPTIRLRRY